VDLLVLSLLKTRMGGQVVIEGRGSSLSGPNNKHRGLASFPRPFSKLLPKVPLLIGSRLFPGVLCRNLRGEGEGGDAGKVV